MFTASITEEYKVFNDCVHGHVSIHPLLVKIIDTPQLQRLRFIKQLGGLYFIFPGASNNRFEHSIGTCFIAGQLINALRAKQPELEINDRDVLCVQIGGLCHDLGHGPFSHLFDSLFIPRALPHANWKHEEASIMMFKHMVESNKMLPVFHHYGLNDDDIVFIQEIIFGPLQGVPSSSHWAFKGRPESKSFLYDIVANKRNGVDVDKWDYFARDCHHLGIKNNFDYMRLIEFSKVLAFNGRRQICYRDKEVGNLYDMFYTRNTLHRRAYQHKTNRSVETMITEALLMADPVLMIKGTNGEPKRMSEAIRDPVAFTKLTDHVFTLILHSDDENLAEARKLLERIIHRNLYKHIGQTHPEEQEHVDTATRKEETIINEILSYRTEADMESVLAASDLKLYITDLDYGMRDEDPIERVAFYMKDQPNKPFKIRKDQVSKMLPERFREQCVQLFCRKNEKTINDIVTHCFLIWCKENKFSEPKGGDILTSSLTPCKERGTRSLNTTPDAQFEPSVKKPHVEVKARALDFK